MVKYGQPEREMKFRENMDFLRPGHLSPEAQDYITELHDIIWRFIRVYCPQSGGSIQEWVPRALEAAEKHGEALQFPKIIDG